MKLNILMNQQLDQLNCRRFEFEVKSGMKKKYFRVNYLFTLKLRIELNLLQFSTSLDNMIIPGVCICYLLWEHWDTKGNLMRDSLSQSNWALKARLKNTGAHWTYFVIL